MMKSRRVRRVIGLGSLAFALTTSIPNRLPAQSTEPSAPVTATVIKGRQATATQSAINKVTAEVEQERRFNELRRELLESRVKLVDWWLTGMAILLTFFGIVTVLVGYFGYRRFRQIEAEARQNVAESKRHADEAASLVAEIETTRDKAGSLLKDIKEMNAQSAAERPDEASEAAENIKENPAASTIDRAKADAVLLQQQGKLEEAFRKWCSIADVVEGTDQDVEAQAWLSIGYLFGKRTDYKAAIGAYDKVLHIDPKYVAAYNNRGIAKQAIGQHEAAITDYDKAIQLDPKYVPSYYNRGIAKKAVGQHKSAITDYDKAIQLDPDLTDAYYNRGIAKQAIGQNKAAVADYDKAIELDPNEANVYDKRGIANSQLGRVNEARQDFQKSLVLAREAGDKDMETRMEARLTSLDNLQ